MSLSSDPHACCRRPQAPAPETPRVQLEGLAQQHNGEAQGERPLAQAAQEAAEAEAAARVLGAMGGSSRLDG